MANEHPSGIPDAYDRSAENPDWARVVVRENRFAQGAEINELQSITERRNRRVGNMTAKDGDRISGADIIIDTDAETATLSAGEIYVEGDIRPVAAAFFPDIQMVGEFAIGVRLLKTSIDELDDPNLVGLHPGSEAEGEPGAARVIETISWSVFGDAQPGVFYGVYLIKDGAVIDQQAPPSLSGVISQIAVYDFDANANYIVEGCEVTSLGKTGNDQVFSIGAGRANVLGFKRIREASIRHSEPEEPDLEQIAAEPHTFTGVTGGSTVVEVSRAPIESVQAAIVVKRAVEVIPRGLVPGGMDDLGFSSVIEIESIVYAGNPVPDTAWDLIGDAVSWAPGGTEPPASSTYTVTYLYNSSVTPTAITDTTVTVSGGVNGRPVLISYTSKLPRTDILCMDVTGRPVYVKGLSARRNALPPITPSNVLKLAEIQNNFLVAERPVVISNGTHNFTYDEQRRYFNRLIDILDQFDRAESERDILSREPVSKKGIFTDTFVDDFYRDQGASQTAAVNKGVLQLAIDDVLLQRIGTTIQTLNFTEEVVISQPLRTRSMNINPYDNFTVMPGAMTLVPPVDFWTDEQTAWTSAITQEFTAAPNQPPGQTTFNEVTEIRRVNAVNLRQITVNVTLDGFGAGENLATLTFDGIDVKPPGVQTANGSGVVTTSFVIPAGVPVGRRRVHATGAAESFCEAIFVGEGTIDITTMRRVTLITRAAPTVKPPVTPTTPIIRNITIINQITQPVIQQNNQDPGGGSNGGAPDPLAQSFTIPEPRLIVGLNFRFTEIGDRAKGVRVQLARMQNGFPSNEVLAEAFISMATPAVGDLIQARFAAPVFLPSDREFCFVILTADPDHSVAVCRLGDVDVATQKRISSQPYTVGVLFSSANRMSWTPHQDTDLHFEIVAAKFAPATKSIDLWTGAFDQVSDMVIRAAVEIPTDDAAFRFELVRLSGEVIQVAPDQTWEFDEFVDETVTLRAVLSGTEKISPILYPHGILIGGRIRESGTYISRLFQMGVAVKIAAVFKSFLPAGSSISVDVDEGTGTFSPLTLGLTDVLGNNWNEPKYEKASHTAAFGRIRITLNGTPAARPSIARLRAYSI
ncbi:DUF4815 domain-containing protein [Microvirga brassicacearum]|uniref:DUF4815 domain-containing protein n=1 Tax=Microvirga brassicacearum TaxID=2580413 RepID=A0A5N3PH73_9HYPH|nr:DUF4815 domain-containing protein [Microvirga brassicacearum]KAB0269068.1 DUF4815 domain-containing protein [Microvirga brassicacearum]